MAAPDARSLARPPTGLTAPVLEREFLSKNQTLGREEEPTREASARARPQPRNRVVLSKSRPRGPHARVRRARANGDESAWCAGELVDGRARLPWLRPMRPRWRARPQGSPRPCSSASSFRRPKYWGLKKRPRAGRRRARIRSRLGEVSPMHLDRTLGRGDRHPRG